MAAAHAKQQAEAYVLSAPCGTWKASAHPEAIDAHADEVPEELETSELFLLFSRPRSESTVLCNHLNQQPDITMLYDVFRESSSFTVDPFGIRKLRCDIGYCEDASWRADLPGFLHALSVRCPTRLCGIRMFDDQAASLDLNQLFAVLSAIQSKQKWQRMSANYRKPANYRSPSPSPSPATGLRLAATGACGDWCEENGATLQQGDEKCGYESCSGCRGCRTGDHAAEKKQMSKADDPFCSKPDLWCVHEGAVNQRKRCGGQLGHFCSDEQGYSGFSPCACAKGGPSTEHPGGPCSTWGHGLTCEGFTLPDDDASPPADNTAGGSNDWWASAFPEPEPEPEPDDSAEAEPVFAGTARFILLEQELTAEFDAISVQGLAGEDWGGTVCSGVDRQGPAFDALNPGLEYNAFADAHTSWFERVRGFDGGELLELTTNQLVGDAEETTKSALSFLGVTPNSDVDLLAPWDDCSTQGGGLEDKLAMNVQQAKEERRRLRRGFRRRGEGEGEGEGEAAHNP